MSDTPVMGDNPSSNTPRKRPPPKNPPHKKPQYPVPGFLRISPLIDPRQDYRYYDPRSAYVERFWMSVLGPSSVWFLRLTARELAAAGPASSDVSVVFELSVLARRLGLGHKGGRNSALMRTIERTCLFGMANRLDASTLEVRAAIPPLPEHLYTQLPHNLRDEVQAWSRTHQVHEIDDAEVRMLAKCFLDMGHGLHETAEKLIALNIDVARAQRATAWSWATAVNHPSVKPPIN